MGISSVQAAAWLERAGIDPKRRGETLSLADFASLTNCFKEVLAETEHICPLRETLEELSVPAEKIRKRYEALINNTENVPHFPMIWTDLILSGIVTIIKSRG